MINRLLITAFLVLAAVNALPAPAFGVETGHFLIQETIEKRIMLLMHRYDKEALVFVTVDLERKTNELPATPFTLDRLELGADDQPRIKAIRVTIHTTLKPVPPELMPTLKSTVDKFGVPPQFDFVDLPKVPELASEDTADETPDADKPADATAATDTAKAEAKTPDLTDPEFFKQLLYKSPLLTLIALMIFAVAACAVVFIALFFRVSSRNWRAIDSGFKAMASSFGDSAGPMDRGGTVPGQVLAEAGQKRDTSSLDRGETFKNLSADSLRALLADCYWGQFDTYAAFIWFRIPVEKRAGLLAKDKYLVGYVGSLSGIDEQDLGLEQEPYYLSPLPINHLNAEAMTELVRGEPRLLKVLPTLRLDSLQLTVAERIALLGGQQEAGEGKVLPNFERIPPSAMRALKQRSKFKIHTLEEELEVLAMRDLTVDTCREIPTLGWLAEAPADTLRELFLGYTAQDLASAWVGPESVLKAMAAGLPEKKLKLVLTYRERMQPSRDSRTFQALHLKSLELKFGKAALGEQTNGTDHARPDSTAA